MSYLDVIKLLIPKECADHTYEFLRLAGKRNVEGVALWTGQKVGNIFEVHYSHIPKQKAYNLEQGLLYSVDGDELDRINIWMHENKQLLIAQIHSHPGAAYHSDTDDAYPIVTKEGSFSIVVPDFASRPLALSDWAVYRLLPDTGWTSLSEEEVKSTIEIS